MIKCPLCHEVHHENDFCAPALSASPASPAEQSARPREDQENIDWKARFESSQSLLARRTEALERIKGYATDEDRMVEWDRWRALHSQGFSGSHTRDQFEAVIGWFSDEASEALSDLGNEEKQEVSSSRADSGSSQPTAVKSDNHNHSEGAR